MEWYDDARAYVNRCPHWGVPLTEHGTRIVRNDRLVCTVHGATFEPETGASGPGPCEGQSLPPLPVELRDETIDIFRPLQPLGRL